MNEFSKLDHVPKIAGGRFIRLLSPFAPHLAEEIWHAKFKPESETIMFEPWPSFDEKYLVEDTVTYAVQVNGKVRAEMPMPADTSKEDVIAAAKEIENVAKWLEEGEIKKEIFVPGKIVGFVVK
jgi:leucyl-tRNA synthetase